MGWEFDGDEEQFNEYVNANSPKADFNSTNGINYEIRSSFLEKFQYKLECLNPKSNLLSKFELRENLLRQHNELLSFLSALRTTVNQAYSGEYSHRKLEDFYESLHNCSILKSLRDDSQIFEQLRYWQDYHIEKEGSTKFKMRFSPNYGMISEDCIALNILTFAFANNFRDEYSMGHILDDSDTGPIFRTTLVEEIIETVMLTHNFKPIIRDLKSNVMTMTFSDASSFTITPWFEPADFNVNDFAELTYMLRQLEYEYHSAVEPVFSASFINYYDYYFLKTFVSEDFKLQRFSQLLYHAMTTPLNIKIKTSKHIISDRFDFIRENISGDTINLKIVINRNLLFGTGSSSEDLKKVSKIVPMQAFEEIASHLIKIYC